MFKMSRRLLLAAAATGCISFAAPAVAQEVRLDMQEYFGPTNLSGTASSDFAKLVSEKTNGQVQINVHFNGSLGLGEADILKTVEQGVVPLSTSMLDKMLGTIPVAAIQSVPFMATSLDESRALFESFEPYVREQLESQNQMLLFEVISLPDGLWSKKPVPDVDALKTLKTRTNSPIATRTLSNVGASPVPMAWGDVAPALVTGVIDSVITTDDNGLQSHLYEQMSDFTRLNMSTAFWIVHMNKDAYNSLSPDEQKAVLEAASQARSDAYDRAKVRLKENSAEMISKGIAVAEEISMPFRQALIEAAAPLRDEWSQKVGADVSSAVLSSYEEAKKGSN